MNEDHDIDPMAACLPQEVMDQLKEKMDAYREDMLRLTCGCDNCTNYRMELSEIFAAVKGSGLFGDASIAGCVATHLGTVIGNLAVPEKIDSIIDETVIPIIRLAAKQTAECRAIVEPYAEQLVAANGDGITKH
jgi:hypothetical protein